jgi:AcrR family transcriptional regulator
MNRRDKQKAETFMDIMRSAEELFMQQGYEKTSMREIAEHSGLTKGALYHHFDSKEALMDRIVAEHHRVLSESAAPIAGDTALPPFDRIKRIMDISRDMGMSHISFVSEYLKVRRDEGSVMLKERLKKYDREFFVSFVGPLLREAKEKGECDFTAAPEMLAVFLCQMDRAVNEEIRLIFTDEPREKAERLIIDIMKTYVYAVSRILSTKAEKVSVLIGLEETISFYGTVLKAKESTSQRT